MPELPASFTRGVVTGLAAGSAYVLGRGAVNNPRGVRQDGSYSLVGVEGPDGEWTDVMPYFEPGGWLQEQECLLVAIPVAEVHGETFQEEEK